jgi:hypothetical protein
MPEIRTAAPRRRRALAELDARIEQAEQAHAQRRLDIENLADSAKSASRANRIMSLAEERLALLRRSREALLADEPARHESMA